MTSHRLHHLQNLDPQLQPISANDRPQFPKLAHGLNLIVGDVARAFSTPFPKLFWWTRSILKVFERAGSRESIFKFLDQAILDVKLVHEPSERKDSIVNLLVSDQLQAQRRGEMALSDVSPHLHPSNFFCISSDL